MLWCEGANKVPFPTVGPCEVLSTSRPSPIVVMTPSPLLPSCWALLSHIVVREFVERCTSLTKAVKPSCLPEKWSRKQNLPGTSWWMTKESRKRVLRFAGMSGIWEIRTGASVGVNERLTGLGPGERPGSVGWAGGCMRWSGQSFHTPAGILASPWASFHGPGMERLPYGCIFTLKDVTNMQLSINIDKAKCDLEAFYNVKIGCDSNHLSFCSKTV